jgi:hypothetical protein
MRLLRERQSDERQRSRLENIGTYALALRDYIACAEVVKARRDLEQAAFDQRALDALSKGWMEDLDASWADVRAQRTRAAAMHFLKDHRSSLLLRALEMQALSWRIYAASVGVGDNPPPPDDNGGQTLKALMERLDAISEEAPPHG